jgi:iron(III) transport system ATP-binding protein
MLSGGQMQRVALARSLVMQPKVLLLDEPLSNLDARLRQRLRGQLRELQSRLGLTSIYVTHDQDEALALADRIALMQGGRIVQIGTPTEIYGSPRSASIADFLGVGNILPVEVVDDTTVQLRDSASRLRVTEVAAGADPKACIRAEDVQLHAPSEPLGLGAQVVTAEFEGASIRYRIALDGGGHLTALAPRRGAAAYAPGEAVRAVIDPADVQVLPAEVAA